MQKVNTLTLGHRSIHNLVCEEAGYKQHCDVEKMTHLIMWSGLCFVRFSTVDIVTFYYCRFGLF